jgi:CRP-like cAMP-binding protein
MNEAEINLEDRTKLLKQIPVFASLPREALSELATLLCELPARAQEPLFRKGDKGDKMYILVEGEVRVHDGNHVIARLGPGNVFGEFALIDEETRSASVTTEKECLLLYLEKDIMLPLMGKYPEILMGLLHTQIKRMRDMNDLKEKLAKSYLKISKQNEEIAQQNTSIKEKSQLVEAQNQELRQLNEQKRQLMSVLIHGLKNPLTSALMMVDLLDQHVENKAAVQEYLDVLIHSMQRMDKVFNDIIRDNQRE